MATVNRLEDLETWKLARMLAQRIFQLYTSSPLFSKDYKLKDQINGSSGSVMDNIAEGFDRGSRNEFINFLELAVKCFDYRDQVTVQYFNLILS